MHRTYYALTITVLFFVIIAVGNHPTNVGAAPLAHRSGCHAAHSCPSDTGSYVCGDKGIYTYCGYGAPASKPTIRPKSSSGSSDSTKSNTPKTTTTTKKAAPPTATSAPPPPPPPTDTPAPPQPTNTLTRPANIEQGSSNMGGRQPASSFTTASTASKSKEYTAGEIIGGLVSLVVVVGGPVWLYRRWRRNAR